MPVSAPYFRFEILHQSQKSRARVGKIYTPHGVIDTPNFVAVGTNGTLKALDNQLVTQIGLQLMFCNTYHLMLQPGAEQVAKLGGLHKFIKRDLPIITDSGGFQVFSLAGGKVTNELKSRGQKNYANGILKISEAGVLFRSYRDGAKILLTPESSIIAQKNLGADIIIPLDELPAHNITDRELISSLERTHRWEERSLNTHLADPRQQAIYAVIHGGINPELRLKSCQVLSNLPFDGFAIGGSLGQNHAQMFEMLSYLMPALPYHKPNHLLGIGDLKSIESMVMLGVDTFDSAYPTKCARHGLLFTSTGYIRIISSSNRDNLNPIDPTCNCWTCQNYSRAYLHHLFKASELTAYTLATIHNLKFMIDRLAHYRQQIQHNLI